MKKQPTLFARVLLLAVSFVLAASIAGQGSTPPMRAKAFRGPHSTNTSFQINVP